VRPEEPLRIKEGEEKKACKESRGKRSYDQLEKEKKPRHTKGCAQLGGKKALRKNTTVVKREKRIWGKNVFREQ